MPAADASWTVEMLDALPDDGQRHEIIDGVLHVTPAPFEWRVGDKSEPLVIDIQGLFDEALR